MASKAAGKASLSKKFVALMRMFIVWFLIGAAMLLVTLNILNNSYISKRDELRAKQQMAEEINNNFDQALFDVRGYIAYGNKSLKDSALSEEPKIKLLVENFKLHAFSKEDHQLIKNINNFNQYYFRETLPRVISAYESGDKEYVTIIANSQGTIKVTQFRRYMEEYLQRVNQELENHYKSLIKIQTYIEISFVLFILVILLLLLRIIRVMLRQIGQPLSGLANAAEIIANGENAVIQVDPNRNDEIGALSIAFQKMFKKVQETETELRARNDDLNSLVSTVSHELRTPLASILGFTELMLQRNIKPERKVKYLTTILNEAKRLTALINDFLDIQRMESGKQTYEKKYIELIPLLKKIIEVQQINTNRHEITLESCTTNPVILGDKAKLEQVFTNLISNAIKYSPEGGPIRVNIAHTGNQIKVSVTDLGLGIPKDSLDKLFTKFYRVDNSDRRKIGGTGLGLAIVQEIVRAHDGEITVQSDYGRGSTFTAVFPSIQTIQDTIEMDQFKETTNGFKILIVEDDQSLAELICQELWDNGFSTTCFKNGTDTMEYLEDDIPDAIVLDVLLEDDQYDGWKIMKELKQNDRLKNIPIIVSTALDEKEKGLSLGAIDFLVKPYIPSHLSKAIMQTLLKVGKVGQILIPENTDKQLTK